MTLLTFSPSGLAEDQTTSLPTLDQSTSLPTVEQCWLSMEEMLGCYSEVYRAFMSGKIGISFGPACCLAINDITSNCWIQMFPNAPHFPPLLQNFCKRFESDASDAPAPSEEPAADGL
ncbi:hypothetical protein L6452_27420 [Arctium lappa]|uniref:Uncharacterized protein n=1 Tax=Arctium lappa TaxID=4217 RepID=A0ACB8ZW56_ARCLA|nr:hypothetical protein L6452_27420 [Arctium lappa]